MSKKKTVSVEDAVLGLRKQLAERIGQQLNALELPFEAAFEAVEERVGAWVDAQGFNTNSKIEKLALIGTEVSEAIEEVRKPGPLGPCGDNVAEELADIVIRVMHYAACEGHDVAGAIIEKMHYNLQRPYKHGKTA